MAAFKGGGINPGRFHRSQIKFYIVLLPMLIFMGLPILFITFHALKPMDELFAFPPRFITTNPTLDNFARLFSATGSANIPVARYLFNSIAVSAVIVVLTIFISSASGYVLSKKRFRGKSALFTINTIALMFVPVAVVIPRYFTVVNIGLINTFLVHILPPLAMPVGLFLIKQFIDQIPDSLVEAAQIDGATDYFILIKIIMPMIKPALATVAIYAFQMSWSATEASELFINNDSMRTFAYYMLNLTGGAGGTVTGAANTGNAVAGQGMAAAATFIMFIPNFVLFILLQSKVMNTMAHSGIK